MDELFVTSENALPNASEHSPFEHLGDSYITVLERIHASLNPKSYLEIGTQSGQSLSIARCPSIAIDPSFQVSTNVFAGKNICHLYQMGSDEFFRAYDATTILNRRLDLAFLDGMHWFEFLLRDFSNVERHCVTNSVIAIHDCMPVDIFSTRRDIHDLAGRETSNHPEWWTGDVWKIIPILQKYRSDLKILALDAPPTGLILITRLDPTNTTLRDAYFDIVTEMSNVHLNDITMTNYISSLDVRSTKSFSTQSQMSRSFWFG